MEFNDNIANYDSELNLEDELLEIFFIDINNIFLKLSTGFIKYDLTKKITHEIKFYRIVNNQKELIGEVTSIYFNEKISFKINNKVYYFGLIASSKGELFISSEIDENNEEYEITCDLIRQFEESILKICFRKIIDQQQQEYLIAIIFSKKIGYLLLIKLNDEMTTEDLNREMKNRFNWIEIYNQKDDVYQIFFSLKLDSIMGNPSSLVIVKDNYKFTYIEFNKDIRLYHENLIINSNEIDFRADLKPGKNKDIIGVHHYNSIIFICFKHSVYLYNYKIRKMLDVWEFEKETIVDLYIQDKQQFYYLIFLTTRNVYFSFMEQKLEDLGLNIRKTIVNHEDSKRYLNRISLGTKLCNYCGNDAGYRCSACKVAYYCSEEHQEKDWDAHRRSCIYKDEDEIQQVEKIEYKSGEFNDKRREILMNLRDTKNQKNIIRATDLTYSMIEANRNIVVKINSNIIKNLKISSNKDSVFYSNVINVYRIFEDYICNILLLAHTIYLKRNKDETFRVLYKLVREMDERIEFNKFIDILCDYLKTSLEKQTEREYTSLVESLYLRYLNLVSTIAKLFYKLGEFSSYEMFIVKTVEKIERIYYNSSSSYILAFTYLIMGNLYVELDSLGKAIQLYTQCLNLLEDPKEKPEIADLYIDANYNLGLLYFVTDQYTLAKNKIDLSIKAKREIKQEEITEQMANFYETLGEIELEYKNHQLSYVNLQKALEIRSKIPNSNDAKSIMKINIMLDFLFQNLEKDIEKKNKTTNQNDKTFMRGEERDLDDVLSYMKVTNDEKGELKRKAETSKKSRQEYDIDEMEKFFLLMSKLTPQQLKILNDTQGDIVKNPSMIKLPIVFSSEFKDIISVNQRLEVCNLKLMSLKRDKILKDPYQKIEVENLNYDALYSRNFQNNLTNIKNYFVVNKILKNWENTTKVNGNVNTTQINPTNSLNVSNINHYRNSRASVKDNHVTKSSHLSPNNSLYPVTNPIEVRYSSFHPSDNRDKQEKIEYNELKSCIFNYAKANYNEEVNEELKGEEEMLYQIYKELEKDDLSMIMANPEIIFKYIELSKENEKTKVELYDNNINKKEIPKSTLKEYMDDTNKIKEEVEEESIISYKSEKSQKSLKSKMEPSSIIDTSNVNDEKNNDKDHRSFKEDKLKSIIEEKPYEEEKKLTIEEKPAEEKKESDINEKKEQKTIEKSLDKSIEDKSLEEKKDKPLQTKFKPNIPNNVKNLLMKQANQKKPDV